VRNSTTFIHTLVQNKINENTKLCSFDIENIYANVPITDVKNTVNEVLNRNNEKEIEIEEILELVDVVLEQNYLRINEQHYIQNEGLAVEAIYNTWNIHQLPIF
jgi:hypothetical protein